MRDLPTALAHLVDGLIERGFDLAVDEEDRSAFGNRLIELRAPERAAASAVRLVKDRGLWNIDIEVGDEWAGSYQVLLALNGAPYSTRAESHQERCATTLAVIDGLTEGRQLPQVRARLAEFRRAYWKRLGASGAE